MEDRDRLIQELDNARHVMLSTLEGLPPDKILYPNWTVKHFLAHLTGWDEATTISLRHHAAGREPGTPAYKGIDFYNAESVSTRTTLDYDHIYKEWMQSREELKTIVRDLPEEIFDKELVYPWGPTGSVCNLVWIMINHEHEHAEELRQILEKEKAGG